MRVLPQELIRRKRDGQTLGADELGALVRGIADGSISDAQIGAFAMATYFKGMAAAECAALTVAMRDSGTVLRWDEQDLPGPVVDKHSTGGVGDLVSLVLAPLVVACGAVVPMITGRGLGHSGGTQDKLDAIPGYCSTPDLARFREVVRSCGLAMIGQTADLAPADKRLYAIRDVTATVDSLPLITASILSKKLAAGLPALVMDVKTGNGAFMPEPEAARRLAENIVAVAGGAGLACTALLTDMSQPLAACAGNALETAEAMRYLRGEICPPRLHQTVLALGCEMLLLTGLAHSALDAQVRLLDSLHSGRAAEAFARMCAALGGPADFVERYAHYLPKAPLVQAVYAALPGAAVQFVAGIDTPALGMAVVALGGGRLYSSDVPDLSVGLTGLAALGQPIDADTPLAWVHARNADDFSQAEQRVRAAYRLADTAAAQPRQIQDRIVRA